MREELLAKLRPYQQEHLLTFWKELDAAQRAMLAGQIEHLDLPLLERLYRSRHDHSQVRRVADRAVSPPIFRLPPAQNPFTRGEAKGRGEAALAVGEIGTLMVAGGQGSRLGFSHPKGMYPIGPVSGHTLFQILVEKIVATARRYGVRMPLCLMTSPATHAETLAFFHAHGRFGLAEDDLHVFCQGMMPALEEATGKILLQSKHELAVSPDGHGGMLSALAESGLLNHLDHRGIRHLFYFPVDNPLVEIRKAAILGYHLLSGSELTTEVIAKRSPLDPVGNVLQVDGRFQVIEYSDLPEDIAKRRNTDGTLQIGFGSIGVHVMAVEMLKRMAANAELLPWHFARKRVTCLGPTGGANVPMECNALKLERYVFDLLPLVSNPIFVEIDPSKEIAPLKNAPGAEKHSPESVRQAMMAQYRRWLGQAGIDVAEETSVEISPLFALNAEELNKKRQSVLEKGNFPSLFLE